MVDTEGPSQFFLTSSRTLLLWIVPVQDGISTLGKAQKRSTMCVKWLHKEGMALSLNAVFMLKECLSRSAFPDNICHCLTDIVPVDEKWCDSISFLLSLLSSSFSLAR